MDWKAEMRAILPRPWVMRMMIQYVTKCGIKSILKNPGFQTDDVQTPTRNKVEIPSNNDMHDE
jgi:hypothetical protein